MALLGTTATQMTATHSQHSCNNSSSMSFSNGTISNGSGLTVSNLGNYYTTASPSITNAVWSVYTNYMKPKSFKLR